MRRVRRLTGIRHELDDLNASWHQHVPALVNAAASVGALAREQARIKREHESAIAQLKAQLQEVRHPACGAAARIVTADKVERSRATGLKLFLGRGGVPPEGYIHVDTLEAPGVDVIAQAHALPFGPAEVSEILASHVLERFTQEELERRLLPHWVSLLEPGGTLRAIVLDAKAMIHAAARAEFPFEDFRRAVFGAQDGGEPHLNMFTAESLAGALRAAGLPDVQVVAEGRRSGGAYELEIAARAAAK